MKEKRIAFCANKGGVGKTTSCCLIAAALNKSGIKFKLEDLDPQGSTRMSLELCQIKPAEEDEEASLVLMDTPARPDAHTLKRIKSADLCVVMATPSPYDTSALAQTLEQINGAKRILVLFNKIQAGTSFTKTLSESEMDWLKGDGYPEFELSKHHIRQSICYQRFSVGGWMELQHNDRQNANRLVIEIMNIVSK